MGIKKNKFFKCCLQNKEELSKYFDLTIFILNSN